MSGSTPSTDLGPWRRAFGVATAPARLLSYYRADLRATLVADAVTFSSSVAGAFFSLLTALAVAYPVAASYVHAVGAVRPRADALTLALSPFFDAVFAESLPFMIAVAGIGTFSPSLGVLFMAVFIPADLIAASRSTVELQSLQVWGSFPAAILARLISYGLLWILAVEIPIAVREWAKSWATRGGRQPSAITGAATRICATAVFVFFWARALPWLIQPVFTWTPQPFTAEASVPTWVYWPILVIGATVVAGVASVWPKPASFFMGYATALPRPPIVRSMGRLLVRQTILMLGLAALLAGLMPTVREAAVLIAGLLVAGPVLTVMLPHVPVPAAVARASRTVRWVMAMVFALSVTWVLLLLAGDALYENYFVTVLTLAVVAPLFRLLLEAGTAPRGVGQAPAAHPTPPTPFGTSTILLLVLAFWLALPSLAWAHDCPTNLELKVCLKENMAANLAMIGGSLLLLAGLLHHGMNLGNPDLPDGEGAYENAPSPFGPDGNLRSPQDMLGEYQSWSDRIESAKNTPPEAPSQPKPRPPGVHGPPQ